MLIWLLPAMFAIHDSEEIIFLLGWLRRNRGILEKRFPRLSASLLGHFAHITPPIFAAMAAEELLLLSAVTAYSTVTADLRPWLALFMAFSIHLLIHVGQALALRRYVPSVATSLLCLPLCINIFIEMHGMFSANRIFYCTLAGIPIAAVNLWAVHYLSALSARAHTK